MKALLVGLLVLGSVSSFAQDNYLASKLAVGTGVEIQNNIEFMEQSTGVFLQKGKAFKKMDTFKSTTAYCFLTASKRDYNYQLGETKVVAKGEKYQVVGVHDNGSSRGRIFISLKSDAGRALELDCQKTASLTSKFADATGIPVYTDNLARLRIKTVKKILDGLMEIQD